MVNNLEIISITEDGRVELKVLSVLSVGEVKRLQARK